MTKEELEKRLESVKKQMIGLQDEIQNFKRQIVAWYSHAYDKWTDVEEDHTYSRDEITHWRPLPDNPEAEDKA